MTTRKIIPAVIGLMLPFAAMSVVPASAQTLTAKKPAHHHVHKVAHKTKAHKITAPKQS